jgi:ribonuclease BN (tRNA processing enzyme)
MRDWILLTISLFIEGIRMKKQKIVNVFISHYHGDVEYLPKLRGLLEKKDI